MIEFDVPTHGLVMRCAWDSSTGLGTFATLALALVACSEGRSSAGEHAAAAEAHAGTHAGGLAAVGGAGGAAAAGGAVSSGGAGRMRDAAGGAGASGGAGVSASAGPSSPRADGGAGAAGSGGREAAGSSGAGGSPPAAARCTRELLASTVDAYFSAIAAHDSSKAPFAPSAKFTENGMPVALGEGLWKTAGAAKLKRSALDPETCSSVTESVIDEAGSDIVLGVRLKLALAKIRELETIVVREGDYVSNPMALLASASDDWATPLPPDQRASRAELQGFVDRYFQLFPSGGCGFAPECVRYENGFSPGRCSLGLGCTMSTQMTPMGMPNRLSVIDVEAGIGVGFTMFQRRYTDFHMFKVRGGMVVGVHAVLAEAEESGW